MLKSLYFKHPIPEYQLLNIKGKNKMSEPAVPETNTPVEQTGSPNQLPQTRTQKVTIQSEEYHSGLVDKSLHQMLISIPRNIFKIEEQLHDKNTVEEDYNRFLVMLQDKRSSLLRTADRWENLHKRNLEAEMRTSVISLDKNLLTVISELRDRLEAITRNKDQNQTVTDNNNPKDHPHNEYENNAADIKDDKFHEMSPRETHNSEVFSHGDTLPLTITKNKENEDTPRNSRKDLHPRITPYSPRTINPFSYIPESHHQQDPTTTQSATIRTPKHYNPYYPPISSSATLNSQEHHVSYGTALQLSSSGKSCSSHCSGGSKCSTSSVVSMKIKLATEAAGASVEKAYIQEKTRQEEQEAREEAERIQQRIARESRNKLQELDMKAKRAQLQLEAIKKIEAEESTRQSKKSSVVSEIPEMTQREKTEAFLMGLHSNNLPLTLQTNPNPDTYPVHNEPEPKANHPPSFNPTNPLVNIAKSPTYPAERHLTESEPPSLHLQTEVYTPVPKTTITPPTFTDYTQVPVHGNLPHINESISALASGRTPQTPIVPISTVATNLNTSFSRTRPKFYTSMPPTQELQNCAEVSTPKSTQQPMDAIQAVCEQMALSRLPIMEPQVFTGQDPL